MDFTNENLPGLLIFIDFEKAFEHFRMELFVYMSERF